jgi:DNA helicase-2/ATP-dependent DNA helicase PcrA
LEYDTVYMMDVFDGQFPESPLPNFQTADLGERKAYEEERRLFYVGMTRAKRQLVLPVLKDNPSCFVQEILHPIYLACGGDYLSDQAHL